MNVANHQNKKKQIDLSVENARKYLQLFFKGSVLNLCFENLDHIEEYIKYAENSSIVNIYKMQIASDIISFCNWLFIEHVSMFKTNE